MGIVGMPSNLTLMSSRASYTAMARWHTRHGKGFPSGFGARLKGRTKSKIESSLVHNSPCILHEECSQLLLVLHCKLPIISVALWTPPPAACPAQSPNSS